MAIYHSKQEERDLDTIKAFGFSEVLNPSNTKYQKEYDDFLLNNPDLGPMEYWCNLVKDCDALIFRSHPDGTIPAGVMKEINIMKEKGGPVLELPSWLEKRKLSVAETREYLIEMGQR
jgi:hypothetical protein